MVRGPEKGDNKVNCLMFLGAEGNFRERKRKSGVRELGKPEGEEESNLTVPPSPESGGNNETGERTLKKHKRRRKEFKGKGFHDR